MHVLKRHRRALKSYPFPQSYPCLQRKEDEVNATLLKVYNEVPGNPAGAATQQESSAAGSGNPGAPGASGLGPTGSSTHGLPPASSGQRAKRTGDTLIRMLAAMFKWVVACMHVDKCFFPL